MPIAALFIIANSWKLPINPSTANIKVSKLHYIHIVENYTTMKINYLKLYSKTWMNLTNITLRERSHTQKVM